MFYPPLALTDLNMLVGNGGLPLHNKTWAVPMGFFGSKLTWTPKRNHVLWKLESSKPYFTEANLCLGNSWDHWRKKKQREFDTKSFSTMGYLIGEISTTTHNPWCVLGMDIGTMEGRCLAMDWTAPDGPGWPSGGWWSSRSRILLTCHFRSTTMPFIIFSIYLYMRLYKYIQYIYIYIYARVYIYIDI